MKLFAGIAALALAVPGLAHAAGNLSGTYRITMTTICQSIENEVFNKAGGVTTTTVNTINEGKISQTVGFITFKPSTAGGLSGTVSANFTQTKGTLAILGLPGGPGQPGSPHVPDMKMGNGAPTGTYSLTVATLPTPSTFSITIKGDTKNSFPTYLSKLSGGVYTHADFINIDGNTGEAPTCSNTGSIDRN